MVTLVPSQPLALASGFGGPGAAGGRGPGLGVFGFTIPPGISWVLGLRAAAAELLCVPAAWAGSPSLCLFPAGPSSPTGLGKQILASPAQLLLCAQGGVPLLQEGLVALRSWHRDCAGNELLLSLDSSSSSQLLLDPSHLLGRFLAAGVGLGLILLGLAQRTWSSIRWPDGHAGSLPAELPCPPQSGAQSVTITLGKITLCHHFVP